METKTVTLDDLVDVYIDNRGKTVPTVDRCDEYLPLIATNCITDDHLYPQLLKTRSVDKDTYDTWFRAHLQPGDILFVNKGTPGKVAMVPNPVNFVVAQDMVGLRIKPEYDTKYVFALLKSSETRKRVDDMHVGTLIPHFKKSDFSNLKLEVIVDLGCQRKIGSLYFDIFRKQNFNQQINENLLRLMNVQWKNMFGSLNAENGHFTDLATVAAGGTPSKKQADYFGGDISWITPKDMSLTNDVFIERGLLNITEAGLRGSSAKLLPKGTLLFSSRAPIGYLGIAANPVTTNQGFKSLVPKRNENTEYLYFLLKNLTSYIEGIAGGSTFKEISGAGMKSVEFPLPTDNQIDAFHNIVTPMFDMVRNNEQQNKKLTDLRDLLLPRLLAGDIDLSNIETVMNNA